MKPQFLKLIYQDYEDMIDDNPASDSSFEIIKNMIRECKIDYPNCNKEVYEATFLPTRLLSVSSMNSEKKLKLIITLNQVLEDSRYLILSRLGRRAHTSTW